MPSTASAVFQDQKSYELIGRRIQRLIANPNVQKTQVVTVAKLESESTAAWQQILRMIEETSGIRMERLEGGAVRIGWREYCDT